MKSGVIYRGPSLLDGKPIIVIATLTKANPQDRPRTADLHHSRGHQPSRGQQDRRGLQHLR